MATDVRLLLLRATLDASRDGILVVYRQSDKGLEFNRRFVELWRIPADIAAAGDDERLVSFLGSQVVDAGPILDLGKDPGEAHGQKRFEVIHCLDGKIIERHSEPLQAHDGIHGRVWFFRDITEPTERNARLQELSATLTALGEMAGGIAHEINNPLAIILGRAGAMKEKVRAGTVTPQSLLAELAKIEVTAERIALIVRGLLTLNRPARPEDLEPTNIADIVRDTKALCMERFKTQAVALTSPHDGLPSAGLALGPLVRCRPAQLSQALVNLLLNALDAVAALPVRWVCLELEVRGSMVAITVTDSGPGIPKDVAAKMMQPFFTTKPPGKGTGLGLSTARSIIERHGGRLFLDTAAAHTRFVIELPLATGTAHTAA